MEIFDLSVFCHTSDHPLRTGTLMLASVNQCGIISSEVNRHPWLSNISIPLKKLKVEACFDLAHNLLASKRIRSDVYLEFPTLV